MQRVDLLVDGERRNVGQRSDNAAFLHRLALVVQTAGRVEVVRSSSTVPPPPAGRLDPMLRNVVFVAEVGRDSADAYLATSSRWALAVTADHTYRTAELLELIGRAKDAHRIVRPWCDCREPDGDPPGTPFRDAIAMAHELGLDEPIGEAESSAEYDHAIAAGARLIVGNPAGLDDTRRRDATARIGAGMLAFTGEVLAPDPAYSGQGVPLASVTVYVAPGGGVYHSLAEFAPTLTPAQRGGQCIYHLHGLRPADFHELA